MSTAISTQTRSRRQESGTDPRGNCRDRQARKMWMLFEFGDGVYVACVHRCGTVLDFDTVQADRIIPGGRYSRDNVQPACGPCNRARSDDADWRRPETICFA